MIPLTIDKKEFKILADQTRAVADPIIAKAKSKITYMEVDVPQNQKEIAFALSLGDLRENAEYKAAKEKQDELNAKVGKLKNELEKAQIFDKSTVTTSKISFGTKVNLLNELTGTKETYTILGPWESDPMKRSRRSPSMSSRTCSSSMVPRVVTARAWVSPRVNRAEPW